MPVAAASLRLKRFRHRFGIRAPRLEVRPRFAWYAYAFAGALTALLLVFLLASLSHLFRSPEVRDVEVLRERLAQLEAQVLQGGGAVSSLEMTHSANRLLADELRTLADDQAVLKDDLAYFLRLVPVGTREGEVRLDRLMLRPDPQVAHRYRFSVLVGYQSGRQPQEFDGMLQFSLTVIRDGKELQVPWPEKRQAELPEYGVKTRQWLRKEGVLEVAPGDLLKRVKLNLVQGKVVRASATVNF